MTSIAFDTNILAYVVGVERGPEDAARIAASQALLADLRERATLVAPSQALGELYVVTMRGGLSRERAREVVLEQRRTFAPAPSTEATFLSALDCATTHRMQLWDSMILSAAAEAGCSLLLSEDMNPGFTWRGCVVVDPFAPERDRRLRALLA